jgi:hypothetical protein
LYERSQSSRETKGCGLRLSAGIPLAAAFSVASPMKAVRCPLPIVFQAASSVSTSATSNRLATKSGAGAGGAYQKSRGITRTMRGRAPGTNSSR